MYVYIYMYIYYIYMYVYIYMYIYIYMIFFGSEMRSPRFRNTSRNVFSISCKCCWANLAGTMDVNCSTHARNPPQTFCNDSLDGCAGKQPTLAMGGSSQNKKKLVKANGLYLRFEGSRRPRLPHFRGQGSPIGFHSAYQQLQKSIWIGQVVLPWDCHPRSTAVAGVQHIGGDGIMSHKPRHRVGSAGSDSLIQTYHNLCSNSFDLLAWHVLLTRLVRRSLIG